MSTSSGALIATATVVKEDLVRTLQRRPLPSEGDDTAGGLQSSRRYLLICGLLMIVVASSLKDVVAGLTIACAILVAGLFIPVVGGIVWKRATLRGAFASIVAGVVLTFGTMAVMRDIYANMPIYLGLAGGLAAFVVVSLAGRPVPREVLEEWNRRAAEGTNDALPAQPGTPLPEIGLQSKAG
jgi:SSS family solute:Na+ symporter